AGDRGRADWEGAAAGRIAVDRGRIGTAIVGGRRVGVVDDRAAGRGVVDKLVGGTRRHLRLRTIHMDLAIRVTEIIATIGRRDLDHRVAGGAAGAWPDKDIKAGVRTAGV